MQESNPGDEATSFFLKNIPELSIIRDPLPIEQFLDLSNQRDTGLEFQLLTHLTDSKRHKILLHNTSAEERVLNRYRDEKIYEHSRVKLNKKVEDIYKDIDYINANIVFQEPFKMILTQGPRPGTINDLYMMLRQEKTEYVIMLCCLKEEGKKKCEDYYSKPIGYQVTETQTISDTIIVRSLKDPKSNHCWKHIHYTGWSDHGIPQKYEDITTIINLIDMRRGVTIHCSAGLGRSGTLAVLLKCMKDVEKYGKVSVFENSRAVRENRYGSIKNSQQYQFIYDYIRSYAESKKNLL